MKGSKFGLWFGMVGTEGPIEDCSVEGFRCWELAYGVKAKGKGG